MSSAASSLLRWRRTFGGREAWWIKEPSLISGAAQQTAAPSAPRPVPGTGGCGEDSPHASHKFFPDIRVCALCRRGRHRSRPNGDLVLGIVGAIAGGWLFNTFGASGVTGLNLYSLMVAVVGAVVVLVVYDAIRRAA